MSNNDECIPIEVCKLPGTMRVTRPALALAEQFQASVPAGWIVAFSWHDGERVRASKDAPWVDNGPGMHLGAYRIQQIPEQAICRAGSLHYAILVREETLANHPQKTIDVDELDHVVLR